MNIYIEDLICRLACTESYMFSPRISLFQGDITIISSFGFRIERKIGLTEKQANLAIRFCKKYRDQLMLEFGNDVNVLIDNPKFRLAKTVATDKSTVQIENKKILLSFPYNEEIIAKIRNHRSVNTFSEIAWNTDCKRWELDLDESNVLWIKNNFISPETIVEDEFKMYDEGITEIIENFDKYLPMLVVEDDKFKFVNVHDTVPQPENLSIKETFLLAKRYGITIYEEKAYEMLKKENFSPIFYDFLDKNDLNPLKINSKKINIDQFADLVDLTTPILIIVPPIDEEYHVKRWVDFLKENKFQDSDISVLFRLKNSDKSSFNQYIKDQNLNNPLTENTKVVFISQKIPKPLIKTNLDFELVINLGELAGVHYTMTYFLNSCPDVVQYSAGEF
jgi:hypothetical protein